MSAKNTNWLIYIRSGKVLSPDTSNNTIIYFPFLNRVSIVNLLFAGDRLALTPKGLICLYKSWRPKVFLNLKSL